MDESARARATRQLVSGNIKASYLVDAAGKVQASDVKTILLNVGDNATVNAFNWHPSDLAKLVMHEGWHTVQLAGMKVDEAAKYITQNKDRLELEANRYEKAHFRVP